MAFTKITAAGIGSTETVTLDGLSVINNGSFGGNLTVGGVLTYEDVTNIDSVGLITARNGIVVGSGITLSKDGDGFYTGVVTATTFSGNFTGGTITGDGSALTGVASTENIRTNTNATFLQNVSIVGTSTVTGNIVPSSDSATDIGTNSVRFQNAYVDTYYGSGANLTGISQVGGATGVDFNDDVKARFGTGNDLEIFHSSDQSYIRNSTNNLRIEADALRLRSKTDTENYIKADLNGAVELYHDNSLRLATTSTGLSVTSSVDLPDNGKLLCGDGDDLQIDHSGTNSQIYHNGTGHLYIATLGTSEDIYYQSTGKMTFTTGGSEIMRITDDGKIGINETSPSYRLHVRENSDTGYVINTATVNSALMLENENTGSTKNIGIYFGGAYSNGEGYITMVGDGGTGGDFRFALRSGGSRTDRMTITNDSTINGDFNDTSDINLKENIVSMSSTIDKVKQLRPVTFDWKESYRPNNVSGFIAQEVKTIYPDLVRGVEWTADDPGKHYTINTMGVVAHLTKALQESITKIEVLETRLNNAGIAT